MEINKIVHSQIKDMMLHIDDIENYDATDFLRENGYGKEYAIRNGFKYRYLPSRLLSDQKLVNDLKTASEKYPDKMTEIYRDTLRFSDGIKELGIRDWLFEHNPGYEAVILRGLGLFCLLPVFALSIVPTALLFILPEIFLKKLIKDQMFISTFYVAVSALVSIPISMIIPAIILWCTAGFWWGLGYAIAFPLMFILSWNYMKMFMKFVGACNFVKRANRPAVKELRKLRYGIFKELDSMLA
jgi:hypothetical protein